MKHRAALLLLPLAAACGDEPDRGYAATAAGARQEPYGAIPPGSVPRGTTARLRAAAPPGPPVTPALLAAGQDAFRGYCAPCHGSDGEGNGPVVRKRFPRPPDLTTRLNSPPAVVAVIANGKGRMPALAEQVPPARRWAIGYYLAGGGSAGE
jgi:mono/diheme cytochrome c family protein